MSTEEIIAIAMGKLINWIVVLVAGYFWLVINHVKKDIDGVANYARETQADVERLEEIATCLKVTVGKLQQSVEDIKESCERRHKK